MNRLIAALVAFLLLFDLGCGRDLKKQGNPERDRAAEEKKAIEFLISKGETAEEKKAIEFLLSKKGHLQWVDPKAREQPGAPYWAAQLSSVSQVADADLVHLKQIKGLKSFYIIGSPHVTDRGIAMLAELDQLEELSLDSHLISDRGVDRIADIRSLKKLTLWGTHGMKITDQGLKRFGQLPNLKNLGFGGFFNYLSAIPITDEGLANLKTLKSLEELDLRGTKITDEGLKTLKSMAGLRILNLYKTQVTDGGLEALAACPSLQDLILAGTEVGDEGVKLLSRSQSLQRLNLSDTKIGDLALQFIPAFKKLTSLRITETKVSDEGLKHLGKSKLLELSLVCCSANYQITDQGLAYLQGIKTLKRLGFHFQGTRATMAGLLKLREALPDLEWDIYPPRKCGTRK